MKKLHGSLVLFLMFLSGICYAQKDTTVPPQNPAKPKRILEMGINLYGLTVRGGDFYSQYDNVLDNQIFSGLYFKIFKGKNALRTALDYSQRTAYYGSHPFSQNNGNRGQLKSVEVKVGYQRMLGKRKFAPYVFSDLEYNYFWQPGIQQQNFYPLAYLSSYSYDYYYRYYTLSGSFFCVTPGLGLRWNIAKCVVLNFEAGAQFFYSHEKILNSSEYTHTAGVNAKPAKFSIGFTF